MSEELREYTLRETKPGHWEVLGAEEAPLYGGCLIGAVELLGFLEDPATPPWAREVATWDEEDLNEFLRRVAVRTPSRKIDRLRSVVALLAEGA